MLRSTHPAAAPDKRLREVPLLVEPAASQPGVASSFLHLFLLSLLGLVLDFKGGASEVATHKIMVFTFGLQWPNQFDKADLII